MISTLKNVNKLCDKSRCNNQIQWVVTNKSQMNLICEKEITILQNLYVNYFKVSEFKFKVNSLIFV